MSQKNRVLLLVGLIILLGVAIYLVQTLTPAEEQKPAEKVEFKASTITGGEEVTFKYTPQTTKKATYTISYEIREGTSTLEAVQKKDMKQIAAENPISINISRKATSTYTIDATIKDAHKRTVYQGTLLVKAKKEEAPKLPAKTKDKLTTFMKENASDIVEKEPVLGGTWHFVEMKAVDAEEMIVNATFEDGHIQQKLQIDFAIEDDKITYEVTETLKEQQTGAMFQNMAECKLLKCDGKVDCYGCVDDNCKNPKKDAICEPYEKPEVGIPYSCHESEEGCALAQ